MKINKDNITIAFKNDEETMSVEEARLLGLVHINDDGNIYDDAGFEDIESDSDLDEMDDEVYREMKDAMDIDYGYLDDYDEEDLYDELLDDCEDFR